MVTRIALVVAAIGLAAFALLHAAPRPVIEATLASPPPAETPADVGTAPERGRHRRFHDAPDDGLVVYVAGAVRKPGFYRLRNGDRNARAIALAGGFSISADATAINLAAHAADGDEIDVPVVGETTRSRGVHRSGHRRRSAAQRGANVDVNRAGPDELAAVPGIGRAIAQRIVDLRERAGPFTSLDELLDVAGMTQSRLERARTYLKAP